jgi:hypothetical protein
MVLYPPLVLFSGPIYWLTNTLLPLLNLGELGTNPLILKTPTLIIDKMEDSSGKFKDLLLSLLKELDIWYLNITKLEDSR